VRTLCVRRLLFTYLLAPWNSAVAQQKPSIVYSSLLRCFTVFHETRRVGLGDVYRAVFPEAAIDVGQAGGAPKKTDFVIRDGSGKELYRNRRTVHRVHSLFTRVAGSDTAV
jgi:hypothetical protein